jgi:PAS domain S-box-containing protein
MVIVGVSAIAANGKKRAAEQKQNRRRDFMARKRIEGYDDALPRASFSTPKKLNLPARGAARSIHPWRDALLAGFAVAVAISFGAWMVYARARDQKVADVQHHLVELARRLEGSTGQPHRSLLDLPRDERLFAADQQNRAMAIVQSNAEETRRIYSFAFEEGEDFTVIDSNGAGDPVLRPIPPHAAKARNYFRTKGPISTDPVWITADGLETTAFALIRDERNRPTGAFGVEADIDRLRVKIEAIREALMLTCLLGLAVGAASGLVVHRIRTRSALVQAELEKNHQAEEAMLRLFFDEAATAHLAFDGDTIVDANPAAVALFGAADKESLLEKSVWELWPRCQPRHGLSVEGWSNQVMAALGSTTSHFEWQFVRADGSLVDCDVFLRHAIFQDRDVLMMECYDISSAKRAQAQLISSEQRFRDVSEAIGEFIWEVDHESRYTYASRRVIEILGVEPEEVLGRTPFEFVPEADRASMRERSFVIFSAGQAFRNFEHRVCHPDGSLHWISVSGAPSYDSAGKISGYRGASLDITKHRAYEQELVLQKEAAEAAARAKSSFLAMMSHEIRTPLNSVLGFADLVLDTSLNPIQREHLQTIKSSGDALLILLNDILDFSKIESGHMQVEIRTVDLSRCINEVIELYQLTAKAKKLTLRTTVEETVPRYLLTDGSRLRQILVNLVGNAVKFTSEGEIRVTAALAPLMGHDAGLRIRISVSDTGIGISAGQRARLFTPFTQADSSTTRRFGGTGLGLAISKRLASLLEGELSLGSHEGPGTTFHLDIPSTAASTEQVASHSASPEVEHFSLAVDGYPGDRPPHVLVVDDNTLNRRLTSHLLHQLGVKTTTVASAQECFEAIASQPFDLVLMDVQMPKMDGLEATRILRSRETDGVKLPIVALTADAMVGDRERCLDAGMTDYLTKPLRRDELTRVLRTYTGAGDEAR